MRWVYTLLALAPLLMGAAGSEFELDGNLAETVAFDLVDLSSPDVGLDGTRVPMLAGKRAGLPFTKKGKVTVKQSNAEKNEGTIRCENCGVETVPAKQHEKGVTPPKNEGQVDHVIPKAKGGDGDPDNGRALCRDCNIKKSDKGP